MRRPSSCRNASRVLLMGSSDSMATGMKSCVAGRVEYLVLLRSAACSAARPVAEAVRWIYEDAHVWMAVACHARSEEHTSELQSQSNVVCRLLLEKKKNDCMNP